MKQTEDSISNNENSSFFIKKANPYFLIKKSSKKKKEFPRRNSLKPDSLNLINKFKVDLPISAYKISNKSLLQKNSNIYSVFGDFFISCENSENLQENNLKISYWMKTKKVLNVFSKEKSLVINFASGEHQSTVSIPLIVSLLKYKENSQEIQALLKELAHLLQSNKILSKKLFDGDSKINEELPEVENKDNYYTENSSLFNSSVLSKSPFSNYPFILIKTRKNPLINQLEIYSMEISDVIIKLLFNDKEEFIFDVVNNGLNSIFTTKSYFKYIEFILKSKLGKFNPISELFEIIFTSFDCKLYKCYARFSGNYEIKDGIYEDFVYIYFEYIQPVFVEEVQSKSKNNFFFGDSKEYIQKMESFFEDYYPGIYPESYKKGKVSMKSCSYKPI